MAKRKTNKSPDPALDTKPIVWKEKKSAYGNDYYDFAYCGPVVVGRYEWNGIYRDRKHYQVTGIRMEKTYVDTEEEARKVVEENWARFLMEIQA